MILCMISVSSSRLSTAYIQRGLICKSTNLGQPISSISVCPAIRRVQLTFLIPSGFCCKATSFSGLTTGILNMTLHIMLNQNGRKDGKMRKPICKKFEFELVLTKKDCLSSITIIGKSPGRRIHCCSIGTLEIRLSWVLFWLVHLLSMFGLSCLCLIT